MRKIDIINLYFKNLIPDFSEYNYCPSYFELEDWHDFKECAEDGVHCKTCWYQETEENKDNILKALRKLNAINNSKIKELYKKEKELLTKIQELCPHKNTYTVDEHDWPDYSSYMKCKDCGKIL